MINRTKGMFLSLQVVLWGFQIFAVRMSLINFNSITKHKSAVEAPSRINFETPPNYGESSESTILQKQQKIA